MGFSIKVEKAGKYAYSKQPTLQLPLRCDSIDPDSKLIICGDIRNDIEYSFTVYSDEPVKPIQIELFFNDEDYKIAMGEFIDNSTSAVLTPCINNPPFKECYGIMQLTVNLTFSDGSERLLKTGHLAVLIRDRIITSQVENMIEYITNNCDPLIYQKHQFSKISSSEKKSNPKSIEGTIQILKRILMCYKKQYLYYKNNSKSKIVSRDIVDSFEKLSTLNYNTLRYISTHPEQLEESAMPSPIVYDGQYYLPQHTLISDKSLYKDVYENKVILSFLKMIIFEITTHLLPTIDKLIDDIPYSKVTNDSDYTNSAYSIFNANKRILIEYRSTLQTLKRGYKTIFSAYMDLWSIDVDLSCVLSVPKYTPTFRQNPTYHKMFVNLKYWYDNGMYEFERERFIVLSFLKSSKIYEFFVLLKLIEALKAQQNVKPEFTADVSPLCLDLDYNNSFKFSANGLLYKLYFQPIIKQPQDGNNIGLFRNNKYTIKGTESSRPYTPDYLLRIDKDGVSRFIVLDAKFRDEAEVKRLNLCELSFKYIFSLTPIKSHDILCGMCIICGKDKHNRDNCDTNAYNSSSNVSYYADFPVITGKDVYEHNTLIQLISKYSEEQ